MTRAPLLVAALFLAAAAATARDFEDDPLGGRGAELGASLRDFKARPAGFRGSPPSRPRDAFAYDPSVPPELRRQLNADLAFVRGLRYGAATPLHRQVFGRVHGDDYMRYLQDRVRSVGAASCGALAAVACVKPFDDRSKMWIGPGYSSLGLPQIYRLLVVMHEARHTEVAHWFWGHVRCPDPFKDENGQDIKGIFSGQPLAGQPGCDREPLGAYGVGLLFVKNVEKHCTGCTGKLRMDAAFYADDTLKRVYEPAAKTKLRDDLYR